MGTIPAVISAIMVLVLLAFVAPSILAMNRGKMLRNIALWLAVVLALSLFYLQFNPQTKAPQNETGQPAEAESYPAGEDSGYTPPDGD